MRKLFLALIAVAGIVFLCRCNLPTFAGMLTEEALTFSTPKGYAAPVPIVRSSWEDRIPSDSPALAESPSLAAPVIAPPAKPTAAVTPAEKAPAKIFKSAKAKSRKHPRLAKHGKKSRTHIARR